MAAHELAAPIPVAVAHAKRRRGGRAQLGDIVREAAAGLSRNRVRAGLSMLGISWGIVSVVMLLAYGNGFQAALDRGFRGAFGDGVVIVWPGQTSKQAGGERAGKRIRLKLEDVLAVREAPLVKFASPEFTREFAVAWGTKQGSYLVRGVAPPYPGAFATIAGKATRLLRTMLAPAHAPRSRTPALYCEDGRCYAVCGDGQLLRILSMEVEGRLLDRHTFERTGRTDPIALV